MRTITDAVGVVADSFGRWGIGVDEFEVGPLGAATEGRDEDGSPEVTVHGPADRKWGDWELSVSLFTFIALVNVKDADLKFAADGMAGALGAFIDAFPDESE